MLDFSGGVRGHSGRCGRAARRQRRRLVFRRASPHSKPRKKSRKHFEEHQRDHVAAKGCGPSAAPALISRSASARDAESRVAAAEISSRPADLQFFTQAARPDGDRGGERAGVPADRGTEGGLAEEKLYLEDEIRTENIRRDRRHRAARCDHAAPGGDRGPHRFDRVDLWRDRVRKGTGGARHSQPELSAPGHIREAELRGHSDGPAGKRDVRPRTRRLYRRNRPRIGRFELAQGAPCSWTKWARSRSNSSPSCCASCRSGNSNGWAAPEPSGRMRAWSQPPIGTLRRWWKNANFAPTSITASTCSR